jgi:hypothetical protein
MKKVLILIELQFLLFTFFGSRAADAFYPELHTLIAYEASDLGGVPSEVHVFIGNPARCFDSAPKSICEGAYDEDADRDPRLTEGILTWWGLLNWGTHFWDPEGGPRGGLLQKVGDIPVNLEGRNAYQRARDLYESAVSLYDDDPEGSYSLLGRVVHLLTDMASPAHVHLDPHISASSWTGDDSLEEYTAFRYLLPDPVSGRATFESDFPIDGLRPADYELLPDGGHPEEPFLYRIFYAQAEAAADYDSDDANGSLDDGNRRGRSVLLSHDGTFDVVAFGPGFEAPLPSEFYRTAPSRRLFILPEYLFDDIGEESLSLGVRLSFPDGVEQHLIYEFVRTDIGDEEARTVALALFPSLLERISGLYRLFWEETHPELSGEDIPLLAFEDGERELVVHKPAPLGVKVDIDPAGWDNIEVEAFVWADFPSESRTARLFFDGSTWRPFDSLKNMSPLGASFRLLPLKAANWTILANTAFLPELRFTLNLCIDRFKDLRYSPKSSVCSSIPVRVK